MKKTSLPGRVILITIMVSLLFGLYFLQTQINFLRRGSGGGYLTFDPTETIPITLLGSFRGVLVDFLWIKGIARHQEKEYYELLAINNLIAKLQPHFPSIWIFQAWNMCYNIAHEWESPEDKWNWIRAGLAFAEKGALKNPESGELFFEIGYIYFHKFDAKTIEFADYYRKKLKEDENKDSYEQALYWIRKSLQSGTTTHNRLAVERTLCYILWRAALRAEKDGTLPLALDYATKALAEWKEYVVRNPEGSDEKTKEIMKTITNKILQLEQQIERYER
ncbi:MAG: hypothetical protein GY941_22815 [Planctomycetes bacterium]|nr:hypothetical protein [Planctomycetota bacterium]